MKKIGWLIVILWTITGPTASPRYLQTDEHQRHQQHEHSEAQQKQRDRDRWMWQLPRRVMNEDRVPGYECSRHGTFFKRICFARGKGCRL